MDLIVILSFILSLFVGMNIGGAGLGVAMAIPYGGGALSRKKAMLFTAIFLLLGAVIAGRDVTSTIGGRIVPETLIDVNIAIIILFVASLCLFLTNIMGIPMSTSETVVGALVGVGLYFTFVVGNPVKQSLNVSWLGITIVFWFLLPLISFIAAFILRKYIYHRVLRWQNKLKSEKKVRKSMNILLVASGGYLAFSAGANNTANAVGPLVGAGLLNLTSGALFGGVFLALGAFTLGKRVLETAGKKITELCILEATLAVFVAGTFVTIASLLGIPVPLAQVIPAAIMGIGCAQEVKYTKKSDTRIVRRTMVKVWVISSLIALTLSFGLISILGYMGGPMLSFS